MDNITDKLDVFLNDSNEEVTEEKEIVIITKTGLVEKIDKVFVTEDGRMLLREELYK